MDRTDKKKTKHIEIEQPVPSRIYPVIDTDLARDNLESVFASSSPLMALYTKFTKNVC